MESLHECRNVGRKVPNRIVRVVCESVGWGRLSLPILPSTLWYLDFFILVLKSVALSLCQTTMVYIQGHGKQPESTHTAAMPLMVRSTRTSVWVGGDLTVSIEIQKISMIVTWKVGFSERVLCMSLLKDKRHIVPAWLVILPAFPVENDMEARQHREKDFCDPLVMPVVGRGWNPWYVCYLLLDGTYPCWTSSV